MLFSCPLKALWLASMEELSTARLRLMSDKAALYSLSPSMLTRVPIPSSGMAFTSLRGLHPSGCIAHPEGKSYVLRSILSSNSCRLRSKSPVAVVMPCSCKSSACWRMTSCAVSSIRQRSVMICRLLLIPLPSHGTAEKVPQQKRQRQQPQQMQCIHASASIFSSVGSTGQLIA